MLEAVDKYFKFTKIAYEETKDLSDADLPSIFICPKANLFKGYLRNLKKHGYNSFEDFLVGNLNGSNKHISWGGLTNISYGNSIQQVFGSNALDEVGIWRFPESRRPEDNYSHHTEQGFTVFDGFCKKLDIDASKMQQIGLYWTILTFPNEEFQISIADSRRSSYYKIDNEALNGDAIVPRKNIGKTYTLQFQVKHLMKNAGKCTDYGEQEQFLTYADCVENHHQKMFQSLLGCMVPWLSAPNQPSVCKDRYTTTTNNFTVLENMISQIKTRVLLSNDHYNVCLKPCVELTVYSKLKGVVTDSNNTLIALSFDASVKIVKYMNAYGLFELVVDVGSSLGLWIGLSAIGVFDLFLKAASLLKKTLNEARQLVG